MSNQIQDLQPFKSSDLGLFIGMMTMPFENEDEFIKYEIESVFKKYKIGLEDKFYNEADNNNAKAEFNDYLYKPACYYLLGSFDIAAISFVDDFHLATQKFHPFNDFVLQEKDYEPVSYTYQALSCSIPNLDFIPNVPPFSLKDTYTKTLNEASKLPFIAITSIKLNNFLLIGNGLDFVAPVLEAIREKLGAWKEGKLAYIITQSYGWNELTIVFFADSFQTINEKILSIRSLSLNDLSEQYKESIKNNSLYKTLKPNEENESLETTHLFTTTHSVFGYSTELIKNLPKTKANKQKFSLTLKWSIKPGHLETFAAIIQKHILNNSQNLGIQNKNRIKKAKSFVGRGDYAFTLRGENAFQDYIEIIKNTEFKQEAKKHIKKLNTIIGLDCSLLKNEGKELFHVSTPMEDFMFSKKELLELSTNLNSLHISKITREKIISMYNAYQDGISDNIINGFFIELGPFLKDFLGKIKNIKEQKNDPIHDKIYELNETFEEVIKDYEKAYLNRFGQAYVQSDITDYNVEFHGGCQQLLSAYDGAYKSATSVLGEFDNPVSFASIGSNPSVTSDNYSIKINYFHLFHPVTFACIMLHEAANFHVNRLILKGDKTRPIIVLQFDEIKNKFENINDSLAEIKLNLSDLPSIYKKKKELSSNDELKWHITKNVCTIFNVLDFLKEKQLSDYGESPINNIHYFLIDILTLELAYNGDFDSFYQWHLNCFAQTTIHYKINGKIDDTQLMEIMVRVALIAQYSSDQNFFSGHFLAPFSQYQDIWNFIMPFVIDKVYKINNDYKKYFEYCAWYAKAMKYNNIVDDIELINQKKVAADELALDIKQYLKKGEVPKYGIDIRRPYDYYNYLFIAYRKLILEEYPEIAHGLLFRNTDDGKADDENNKRNYFNSKVIWDPLGGTFSINCAARRDMLKFRTALINSIWHLSMVNKESLFKKQKTRA